MSVARGIGVRRPATRPTPTWWPARRGRRRHRDGGRGRSPPGARRAPTRHRRRRGGRRRFQEAELPTEPVAALEDADARRRQRVEHLAAPRSDPAMPPPTTTTWGPVATACEGMSPSLSRAAGAPDATLDGRESGARPGPRPRVRPWAASSSTATGSRPATGNPPPRRGARARAARRRQAPTKESPCASYRAAPPDLPGKSSTAAAALVPLPHRPLPPSRAAAGRRGGADDSGAAGSRTQSEEMARRRRQARRPSPGTRTTGAAAQPQQGTMRTGRRPLAVLDRKLSRRADISITVKDVDDGGGRVRPDRGHRQGHGPRRGRSRASPTCPRHGGYSTITPSRCRGHLERRRHPPRGLQRSRSRSPDRLPTSVRSTPATPRPTT